MMKSLEGERIAQSDVTALMWFEIARMNGAVAHDNFMNELATRMTPDAMDEARKRAQECVTSDYLDCD